MSAIARRATTLIREMLSADGNVPPYNEEVIRVTLEQIDQCRAAMEDIHREAKHASVREGADEDDPIEWASQPERFAAVIIHHETIVKLKRILLTYMKMRSDCLRSIRWEQRHLPAESRENLSPAEIEYYKEYDRVLNKYIRASGMDLTTDLMPPRDAAVRVRVLQNHGTLSTSASAKVDLVKGSVHSLARGEAEHLIRMGVLQALDNY